MRMATMSFQPIHASPIKAARYIVNPDKVVPAGDVQRVLSYMRDGHIERAYTFGHNGCSANIELAIQQFGLAQLKYNELHSAKGRSTAEVKFAISDYAKKKHIDVNDEKKLEKMLSGVNHDEKYVYIKKEPILAQHCFLSFPEFEHPSPDELRKITDELMHSDTLSRFYAISAAHYNTDNAHIHLLISNFAKDGSRTISMNNERIREIRAELDRICVSHGYSIIENSEMRQKCGTKYSEWVDEVIKGCCITVIPENGGSFTKQGRSKKGSYHLSQKAKSDEKAKKTAEMSNRDKKRQAGDTRTQPKQYIGPGYRLQQGKNGYHCLKVNWNGNIPTYQVNGLIPKTTGTVLSLDAALMASVMHKRKDAETQKMVDVHDYIVQNRIKAAEEIDDREFKARAELEDLEEMQRVLKRNEVYLRDDTQLRVLGRDVFADYVAQKLIEIARLIQELAELIAELINIRKFLMKTMERLINNGREERESDREERETEL